MSQAQAGGMPEIVREWWEQITAAFLLLAWAVRRWVLAPYAQQQAMAKDVADLKASLLRACDNADEHSRKIDNLSSRIDRVLEVVAHMPRPEDERG